MIARAAIWPPWLHVKISIELKNHMRITIRQLFVLVLFLAILIMSLRPIADPDFWWHLRTGQLIVETQAIPHNDPFSFTNTGKTWIAHEWLAEILLYLLYSLGGYGLLIFTFALIITTAFILIYLQSPGKPYIAGFTVLLGALATAPTWGVRPQMISLLLTCIALYLLDKYQANRQVKFILPLPFITVLWVNLHAGYLLGIGIIVIYLVGDFLDFLKRHFFRADQNHPPSLRSIGPLAGVLGLCVLAAAANPNGFRLFIYPFETLNSPSMQQFIQEWFSPDFHQVAWQPLAWLILALIGAGLVGRRPISPTRILLTILFIYAALRSMRFVPLFAIVAVPVIAEEIDAVIRSKNEVQRMQSRFAWLNLLLLGAIVIITILRFASVVQEQPAMEQRKFPAAAVDWIANHHPEGKIYNTYGWGGYLIWRLYPEYQVFIDGRADVYGDKFIYDYLSIYRADPGWNTKLDADNVRIVLVEVQSPLAIELNHMPDWQIAFSNENSILFIR